MRLFSLVIVSLVLFISTSNADDWPMWRHDIARTGITNETVPSKLSLKWQAKYSPPKPAWPDPRLDFDKVYQPIIAGKTLYFGSSSEDCLVAIDTETGAERWRFYAEGPIRLAPAFSKGKIYFVSDDGHLYCLNAETGKLVWKFFGAIEKQKALGNERLISLWPARGGPIVDDGVVYFASGVWPFMGIFVYALDAETGKVKWNNDRSGVVSPDQKKRNNITLGGLSPQGCLAISGEKLIVPNGRSWPAFFNRKNGEMESYASGWKDTAGGGGCQVSINGNFLVTGGWVMRLEAKRSIIFNSVKKKSLAFTTMPLIEKEMIFWTRAKAIEAHSLKNIKYKNTGVYLSMANIEKLWSIPTDKPVSVMIKAANRIFLGVPGEVFAIDLGKSPKEAVVTWKSAIKGTPGAMAVANGKLFVSTQEGSIYCFSGEDGSNANIVEREIKKPKPIRDTSTTEVERILSKTGIKDGYCYVLGIKSGRLVEELAKLSNLKIIAIDPDPEKTNNLRKKLIEQGIYGDRVAVLTENPLDFGSPPYLATLILSERPEAIIENSMKSFIKKSFPSLRPYGGVICLKLGADQQAVFNETAAKAKLVSSKIRSDGDFIFLSREGPLPGSDEWPNEKGPGNTKMSQEKLVRAPMGVLWFGGDTGNKKYYLNRHAAPPTPRVCEGRIFIYGKGVTAVDVYTGRMLWHRGLFKTKPFSSRRNNVIGGVLAYASGGKRPMPIIIAKKDGLYVAYGTKIQIWSPSTGKTLKEFTIPDDKDPKKKLYPGYIKICGDILVAGAEFPTEDVESVFVPADFAKASSSDIQNILNVLKQMPSDKILTRESKESDLEFILRSCNHLLSKKDLNAILPAKLKAEVKSKPKMAEVVAKAVKEADKWKSRLRYHHSPFYTLEGVNRKLLEAYFPFIKPNPKKFHWHNLIPWDGIYTKQIVGLDRHTGKVLWRKKAKYSFPQESIVVGNDKVFCLDRVDMDIEDYMKRRKLEMKSSPRLLAFDAKTGKEIWRESKNILGYQLMYSAPHDALVRVSTFDPSPKDWWNKPREMSTRFIVCQGKDGKQLWDYTLKLKRQGGGHRMWYDWFINNDTLVLESYFDRYAKFHGFNLMTGKRIKRKNALTGKELPWGFRRSGGCTKSVGCENMILFRSSTAAFFDVTDDGGTTNLSGFRTGCKNALIPGAGILNAPNSAAGCTCNYSIYTALALTHRPDMEYWSANHYAYDGEQVQRVGINIGALGDRTSKSKTLWLDFPSVGEGTLDIPIKTTPADARIFYKNSLRLLGNGLKWVASSGVEGLEKITITLSKEKPLETSYTVRLFFSEPDGLKAGERIFSIDIQEQNQIKSLDISKEAGGSDRVLVKTFNGIKAGKEMTISMNAQKGKTILCGIELIAEKTK